MLQKKKKKSKGHKANIMATSVALVSSSRNWEDGLGGMSGSIRPCS